MRLLERIHSKIDEKMKNLLILLNHQLNVDDTDLNPLGDEEHNLFEVD